MLDLYCFIISVSIYILIYSFIHYSDLYYEDTSNVYTWYYASPTPYDIILIIIFCLIFIIIVCFIEYRRRIRASAMSRYTMKRMRRKFKALQRDEGNDSDNNDVFDWRRLYSENYNKNDPKLRKLIKLQRKAQFDKKRERREKNKKKREKLNEKMKKKLRDMKNIKEKAINLYELNDKSEINELNSKKKRKRKRIKNSNNEDELLLTDNIEKNKYEKEQLLLPEDEDEQILLIENMKNKRYKQYETINESENENDNNDKKILKIKGINNPKNNEIRNISSNLMITNNNRNDDNKSITNTNGLQSARNNLLDPLEAQSTKFRRSNHRYQDYEKYSNMNNNINNNGLPDKKEL